MMNILVTDDYSASSIEWLKLNVKEKISFSQSSSPSSSELKNCQALLIRSKTKINEALLSKAPRLKWVGTATSGLDHIDQKACHDRSISIFNPVEANAISAAEHTWALLLSLGKNIVAADQNTRKQKWKTGLPRGVEFAGKSLSIIGLGRVGAKVAGIAKAFSMNVCAHDPYKNDKYFEDLKVKRLGLSEAISNADVLTVHTPLTAETQGLINRKNLILCSSQCLVINTSRGQCIDQNDLIQFLDQSKIKGAAIDVFQKEPLPVGSAILKAKNLIISPHIGAYTQEAFERASLETASWLATSLKTEPIER